MKQMDIRLYFGVFLEFIEIFVLLGAGCKGRSRMCLHFPILTCVMLYVAYLCQVSFSCINNFCFFSVKRNYHHIFKPLISRHCFFPSTQVSVMLVFLTGAVTSCCDVQVSSGIMFIQNLVKFCQLVGIVDFFPPGATTPIGGCIFTSL